MPSAAKVEHLDVVKVAFALAWVIILVAAVLVSYMEPGYAPVLPGAAFVALIGAALYGVIGLAFGLQWLAYYRTPRMYSTSRTYRIAKIIPLRTRPGHFAADLQEQAGQGASGMEDLQRARGKRILVGAASKLFNKSTGHEMLPWGGFDLRVWLFASDPKDGIVHIPWRDQYVTAAENVFFFRDLRYVEHDHVCASCIKLARDNLAWFNDNTPILEPAPVMDDVFADYIADSQEARAIVLSKIGIPGAARDFVSAVLNDPRTPELIRRGSTEALVRVAEAWLEKKKLLAELANVNFDRFAAEHDRLQWATQEINRLTAANKRLMDENREWVEGSVNRARQATQVYRPRSTMLAPAAHELAERSPVYGGETQ